MLKGAEKFLLYNDKEIKDIAPTQTTNCGSSTSSAAVLISENGSNYLKIRKLTPLECWRLMGFDDEDFYAALDSHIKETKGKDKKNPIGFIWNNA